MNILKPIGYIFPRFTLRTILFSIFACALALGWIVVPDLQERTIAARLENMGVTVGYDDRSMFCSVRSIGIDGANCSTEVFRDIGQLENLKVLELTNVRGIEGNVQHFAHLKMLECLSLKGCAVTDADFLKLRHTGKLARLDLGETRVSDATVDHISTFDSLERLYLDNISVSDASVLKVTALQKLNVLSLLNTASSDAFGELLRGLPNTEIGWNRNPEQELRESEEITDRLETPEWEEEAIRAHKRHETKRLRVGNENGGKR